MTGRPAIALHGVARAFGRQAGPALDLAREGADPADIKARTGTVVAVQDVSLSIPPGELFVLMGLSGSGKSTLLRVINGLIPVSAGRVEVLGRALEGMSTPALNAFRRDHLAMVFQRFALLPHRSVVDNIALAGEIRGVDGPARRALAHRWIAEVGLAGFEQARPAALSGGMQQRVGLARALASEAPILLMDEPFSALDPLTRAQMQDLVAGLHQEFKRTLVFVTHDLEEALRLADRIAVMKDGRIVQIGTPADIALRPETDYVAAFAGNVNRARLLRVAALMSPTDTSSAPIALGPDETLEAAAGRFADSEATRLAVADSAQHVVGELCRETLLRAIAGKARPL